MEVHHNPHTARKKWTDHLWEFLMLFLAVFCGFLAENQREHYVESLRAKEYANSLLGDMVDDSVEVTQGIRQSAFIASSIDSCVSIGLKKNEGGMVPGSFYYYSRIAINAYFIDWSESTITQLLQSGNLRYFKNKSLVDKINKYYSMHGVIGSANETDRLQRMQIMEVRNKLLEAKYYTFFAGVDVTKEMEEHVADKMIDSLISTQLSLNKESIGIMNEYLDHLADRKVRIKRFAEEQYADALTLAVDIIKTLRSEYHLK